LFPHWRASAVRQDGAILLQHKKNHETMTTIIAATDQAAMPDNLKHVYVMTGTQDRLEVFPDRLCITPQGLLGFLNKGMKGTKTIPYFSITAVQFKEADVLFNGFLQFTIPGGNESRGGIFAATQDENTFMFRRENNSVAAEIKSYVERAVYALRETGAQRASSVADELRKLAGLRSEGVISDAEFEAAKAKLLG
jgi:hypothetical protein